MKRLYKILRTAVIVILALAFLIPSSLYVALSIPSIQQAISHRVESALSDWLTVRVDIGEVSIAPFNKLTLRRVVVYYQQGDTIVAMRRLGAGTNLAALLLKRRLEFNYAELIDMDARISKASPDAPLNIQPIIDALSPKDPSKPPTQFDLAINSVLIRRASIAYDVASEPHKDGRFDPNHIRLSDFSTDAILPRIANGDFTIALRRLAFEERSGLKVKNIGLYTHITDSLATVEQLVVALPSTELRFADFSVDLAAIKSHQLQALPINLSLLEGSGITPSDFKAFAPELQSLDSRIDAQFDVAGTLGDLRLENLQLAAANHSMDLRLSGDVKGLPSREDLRFNIPTIDFRSTPAWLNDLISSLSTQSETVRQVINNAGELSLLASASGSARSIDTQATLATAHGSIDLDANIQGISQPNPRIVGQAQVRDINVGNLTAGLGKELQQIGLLNLRADVDAKLMGGKPSGMLKVVVDNIEYRGHTYHDIVANAGADADNYDLSLHLDNPSTYLDIQAALENAKDRKALNLDLTARDIDLYGLNLINKQSDKSLSLSGHVDLSGSSVDDMVGEVSFRDIAYANAQREGLNIKRLNITAEADSAGRSIVLTSDVVDGSVTGDFKISTLIPTAKSIIGRAFPELMSADLTAEDFDRQLRRYADDNNLVFKFDIKDTAPLADVVKLPVNVIYPATITGGMNSAVGQINLSLDAPYLQKKNSLIENTALRLNLGAPSADSPSSADFYFTSLLPTKKGPMSVSLSSAGINRRLDTNLAFRIARDKDYFGEVNFTTIFDRDSAKALAATVLVNPGRLVFNDTTWTINPATIRYADKHLSIDDLRIDRPGQYLDIAGTASASPSDSITLTLHDVDLDYVFETLEIRNVTFGGNATGKFYASSLFSSTPYAYTPRLSVKGLSYNGCVIGDAIILSRWNPQTQAVELDADVTQYDSRHTKIFGSLYPIASRLDLNFDADHVPVGFLKPFFATWASDVSGVASGKVRLFGTFHLVDITGDVFAENLKLKVGFTNTTYQTTDSVHFSPGRIDIPNITISDIYGHKAQLDGWVTHRYLKEARFDFRVTDAKELLVYDVKEGPANPQWGGRIFGDGSVRIDGAPGMVNITADMTTAANSTFTYVLVDRVDASDYKFITFRDRNRDESAPKTDDDAKMEVIRQLKNKIATQAAETSDYKIDIAVDVTPQTYFTLVMDPVSGDKIRAYGSGRLRMTYDSANDDVRMFGTYTLSRGNYNFTLQDIIIKDFSIKDGSSITFHGDPNSAQLDIKATYAVNANLSDLDESFLEDKDLNRTNVPVHALLNVTGDMRQPDINFDLEFPTLTQDTYRKVKSIVSTEEMMNRQIIYLLALNRFYTPEYMSATKGSELMSVASSTISSQLSSMLGQLSDKWSIAPNFRSDRGDFSDVEVDVALSSHLLNNRLLLNGNFGYRDKSLNNNSFIGDFDIEYLLNRSGTIRLKAYNRYNDQNYYLKSALTTQGVGVAFKREFDDFKSFMPWLFKKKKPASEPTDSIQTANPDDRQQ